MRTTELTMKLDRTKFSGRVRCSTNDANPEHGSGVGQRERRAFETKVDLGTVQRWGNQESEVPAWAMLLVSKMAEESSRGRTSTHTWLRQLADDAGRPTEIDVDTVQSSKVER